MTVAARGENANGDLKMKIFFFCDGGTRFAPLDQSGKRVTGLLTAISKPASSLLPEPRDRPRREPGESPEAGRSGEKNRIIINIEENYNFFVGLTNGCQLAAVTESVPFFEILFFFFAVISSSIKRPRGKENLACSP